MRKIIFIVFLFFQCLHIHAQTFSWTGYQFINYPQADTIQIPVNNMTASITGTYGLARVCFDVYHNYKSDVDISLISPDGTRVQLVKNVGGSTDNFFGTCVANDGVPFGNGQAPFTGSFLPFEDVNLFNNGQDPNGIWKLVVKDIASPDTGSIRFASIVFANDPPASQGTGGNNTGPAGPFVCATCVCPGGALGCDLLPDVTSSAKEILSAINEQPGALYISNTTPNIGYGPIELYGIDSCFCDGVPASCLTPCPNSGELEHIVRQRIYRKIPGSDTLGFYDRTAGKMEFHPEHGHLHVDNWASYTLRTRTSNPDATTWPIVSTGVKQSFCLVNLGLCSSNPGLCLYNNGDTVRTVPNQSFGFRNGCGLNQGIYPGHYDRYGASLNDPIPLDNVCNGEYYIVSITDPNNDFLESDETNNWVAVPITLTKQNTTPLITANGANIICAGDSITLTSSVAANYLWSTGETTQSIVVKTAGTYTITTNCGLTSSTSLPFTVAILPANQTPSISIVLTAGNNPACANTPITFTATAVNGGNAPTYQWKINGSNVGTNNRTFTTTNLTDGQTVSCQLISNIACLSTIPTVSNGITVAVTPVGSPKVTVTQIKGSNPLCVGDTATFAALTTNASNISYQWKLNGNNVGTNTNEYTSSLLTNGATINCEITATATCPTKATIGTGIIQNSTTSSLGAAYPTYYGNGRQQYIVLANELTSQGLSAGNITSLGFVTGPNVGNPSILKSYSIKMGSTTANTLTSVFNTSPLTTVLLPTDYTPTINSINTHEFNTPFYWNGTSNVLIDICFSNQVIGRSAYQTLQSYSPTILSSFYHADTISGAAACSRISTSSQGNYRPNMSFVSNGIKAILSNTILISANSANNPSVTIEISKGNTLQCAGSLTSIKAIPNNTGANPVYKWTKNNVLIDGNTSNVLENIVFNHGDTIQCTLTSGQSCGIAMDVTSNKIGIQIPEPIYTFIGNGNWNIASNWVNNKIPPTISLSCSEIIINPAGNGECILNIFETIAPGSKITVINNKKFKVLGNLLIQQ
jgi:hypothetical protein